MNQKSKSYELAINKEDFKFSSAHYAAHGNTREKLHGHNYRVSVWLRGQLGSDGCVIEFSEIKSAIRRVCRSMDELFLCPMKSPSHQITVTDTQIELRNTDNTFFSFPIDDVLQLPLENTTVEELAEYVCGRIINEMDPHRLSERSIEYITVGISETAGQEGRYTHYFLQ